jgi:hypothetical protein
VGKVAQHTTHMKRFVLGGYDHANAPFRVHGSTSGSAKINLCVNNGLGFNLGTELIVSVVGGRL